MIRISMMSYFFLKHACNLFPADQYASKYHFAPAAVVSGIVPGAHFFLDFSEMCHHGLNCAQILHEPSNLHPDFRSMWRSKYARTSLAARHNIAFCENCHLYTNETIYVKCFCPKQHFHKTRFFVPVRVSAFWRGFCSDATF